MHDVEEVRGLEVGVRAGDSTEGNRGVRRKNEGGCEGWVEGPG